MLEVCSELKDVLPVQKVTEDDKDFAINFYQEPKQSKRQLITLIQIIGERVKSRAEYLKLVKLADPDIYINEAPNQQTTTLAEEQAKLLVGVYGRLTSCVFDISAMIDLLTKDDQSVAMKEMLAHVLAFSLAYTKTQTLTV